MRTDLDFSKHELKVTKIGDKDSIFTLQISNSNYNRFVFIVTEGITAVTGDYFNWIFSREFDPHREIYVLDHYWAEKLRLASNQKSHEFSAEETEKIINEQLENAEDYGLDGESIEYLNECKNTLLYGEFEYTTYAYNNYPKNWDSEMVPFGKVIELQLLYVFDAFEEIIKRLKK